MSRLTGLFEENDQPLLDAERELRRRNKHRHKAQQVQAGLHMYARYVNEDWLIPATP